MTDPHPAPGHRDDEADAVELLAGEGPIDHPGDVEDEVDEGTESPASDTDAAAPSVIAAVHRLLGAAVVVGTLVERALRRLESWSCPAIGRGPRLPTLSAASSTVEDDVATRSASNGNVASHAPFTGHSEGGTS